MLAVPRYSAVAGLDINSCVGDVTSHDVVGEVRLQNVQIRIDGDLNSSAEF